MFAEMFLLPKISSLVMVFFSSLPKVPATQESGGGWKRA